MRRQALLSFAAGILAGLLSSFVEGQNSINQAITYQCDESLNQIDKPESLRPSKNNVRICIEPVLTPQENNVVIVQIENFRLERGAVRQRLVQAGRSTDEAVTRVDCLPSSPKCSISTAAKTEFFESDGTMLGLGAVTMLFGAGELRNQPVNGTHSLRVEIPVDDGKLDSEEGKSGRKSFKQVWDESEPYMKMLWVLLFLVAFLIFLCLVVGICYWEKLFASLRPKEEESDDESEVDKDNIFMEEASITYSVEEEMNMSRSTDTDSYSYGGGDVAVYNQVRRSQRKLKEQSLRGSALVPYESDEDGTYASSDAEHIAEQAAPRLSSSRALVPVGEDAEQCDPAPSAQAHPISSRKPRRSKKPSSRRLRNPSEG